MTADTITALAALVAAIGAIVATVLAYRARRVVEDIDAKVILIGGEVREVGRRIDGRLTQLLKSTGDLARGEGFAAGEQAERDRQP